MNAITEIFQAPRKVAASEISAFRVKMSPTAQSLLLRAMKALEYVEQDNEVLPCEGCDGFLHPEHDETVTDDEGNYYCHEDCKDDALFDYEADVRATWLAGR